MEPYAWCTGQAGIPAALTVCTYLRFGPYHLCTQTRAVATDPLNLEVVAEREISNDSPVVNELWKPPRTIGGRRRGSHRARNAWRGSPTGRHEDVFRNTAGRGGFLRYLFEGIAEVGADRLETRTETYSRSEAFRERGTSGPGEETGSGREG